MSSGGVGAMMRTVETREKPATHRKPHKNEVGQMQRLRLKHKLLMVGGEKRAGMADRNLARAAATLAHRHLARQEAHKSVDKLCGHEDPLCLPRLRVKLFLAREKSRRGRVKPGPEQQQKDKNNETHGPMIPSLRQVRLVTAAMPPLERESQRRLVCCVGSAATKQQVVGEDERQ